MPVLSILYCAECGTPFPIRRCRARRRGHMKPLWCIRCRRRTLHIEGVRVRGRAAWRLVGR